MRKPNTAMRVVLVVAFVAALSGALVACDDAGRAGGESVSSPVTAEPSIGGSAAPSSPRAEAAPEAAASPSRSPVVSDGAPPSISSVSPRSGPAGIEVTIRGANFARPQVMFGDAFARVVRAELDSLVVIAPEGASGVVPVIVTNPSGQYTLARSAYAYR